MSTTNFNKYVSYDTYIVKFVLEPKLDQQASQTQNSNDQQACQSQNSDDQHQSQSQNFDDQQASQSQNSDDQQESQSQSSDDQQESQLQSSDDLSTSNSQRDQNPKKDSCLPNCWDQATFNYYKKKFEYLISIDGKLFCSLCQDSKRLDKPKNWASIGVDSKNKDLTKAKKN